ncbi:MAG: hypothetical protein ACK559_21515 [bacterium]
MVEVGGLLLKVGGSYPKVGGSTVFKEINVGKVQENQARKSKSNSKEW